MVRLWARRGVGGQVVISDGSTMPLSGRLHAEKDRGMPQYEQHD